MIYVGVLTLKYSACTLTIDLQANDEIIACSLLKTDELIMTMQFIGHEPIGILHLKYKPCRPNRYMLLYICTKCGWEKGFEFGVCGSGSDCLTGIGKNIVIS